MSGVWATGLLLIAHQPYHTIPGVPRVPGYCVRSAHDCWFSAGSNATATLPGAFLQFDEEIGVLEVFLVRVGVWSLNIPPKWQMQCDAQHILVAIRLHGKTSQTLS
jgi:hypothetical protein